MENATDQGLRHSKHRRPRPHRPGVDQLVWMGAEHYEKFNTVVDAKASAANSQEQ